MQKKNHMKSFKILVALLIGQFAFAQESVDSENASILKEVDSKNLIKINALALVTGNFSVQYERSISKKITVGGSVNYMPNRKLPFSNKIEDFVNDETTVSQLQSIELSSFSITPEVRYYFGKEVFKGFYIAPFIRYGSYSLKFPVNYTYENQSLAIDLDGKVNAISGGIAIGAQWKIAKDFYLDWMIMGPHYGFSNGNLSGNQNLNEYEQMAINEALNDLDIPLIDYTYEVNDRGTKINIKGPWAGLRASVGIGYRF